MVICVVAGFLSGAAAWMPLPGAVSEIAPPLVGAALGAIAGTVLASLLRNRVKGIREALERWRETGYETTVDFKRADELDCLNDEVVEVPAMVRTARGQANQQARQVKSLVELSGSLVAAKTPHDVSDRLLQGGMRELSAEGAILYLRDDPTLGELTVRLVRGQVNGRRLGDKAVIGEGPVGTCAKERRPVVIRPGLPDRLVGRLTTVSEERNALCVPLISQDQVVGVLELLNKRGAEGFTLAEGEYLQALSASAAVVIQNVNLTREVSRAFLQTVRSLADAVDKKDAYTQYHSTRVSDYAVAMGRELGLEPFDLDGLQYGGLLHDIGKIAIHEEILNKPGRLSDEEFAMMQKHPVLGAEILLPVDFPWLVEPMVRHHHERWDGRGYPDGVAGTAIHRNARMVAICDAFDAMTTNRPYRPGMPVEEALAEIVRCQGNQFDPDLVHLFQAAFEREGESIMDRYEAPASATSSPSPAV